jgi:hypothetical protein
MMVLRFHCVPPIVSHELTRPDDRGVTHCLQQVGVARERRDGLSRGATDQVGAVLTQPSQT